MGSETSRINNCCSCLEQTQVGESTSQNSFSSGSYSKKQNMISLQKGISIINDEDCRSSSSLNLVLLGDKQCGKTTFINQLKGKNSSSPLPTLYPCQEMVKANRDQIRRAILLNEVDFEYYHSNQSRSLQKKSQGFIFVIKYDENKQNLIDQIRNFSRIDKKQTPCAIVINLFSQNSEDDRQSIKQDVKNILSQYSINACAIEFMNDRNTKFLSDMSKLIEASQISQVK
ncbi:miro-like protein (macronuclear) [Tetrahymena thermophila SB210]|uniref:Miro-like protein n=1 Tax=Tetrahymena thermophila (strain SB210) TaxID=312017 RepID=Q22YV5_TETTS|nr:miro-like protein [Tetrahymena thermophila SB210]EAR90566.2 miro-like protein [Tetrahymena thermophila SB210]|eukprot:XP_001010811.2 miro-like protein [Tetrahymena thermophila SB210]